MDKRIPEDVAAKVDDDGGAFFTEVEDRLYVNEDMG